MSDSVKRFRWLHISDLHFKADKSYDSDRVLSALISSAERFYDEGHRPDCVFVTGDVAFSGAASEYERATEFFDALLRAVKVDRSRLFVVPGNHDVDRAVGGQLKRTLHSNAESDQYFTSSGDKLHLSVKLTAYSKWYNKYFDGIHEFDASSTCQPRDDVVVGGVVVSIGLINTSAFCQDGQDHNKLWVGRSCISNLQDYLNSKQSDLKIALMHHPLDWLHDDDRSEVTSRLRSTFDLALRGHLHKTEVEDIASTHGDCLHLAAGATYQTTAWPNTAMYGDFVDGALTITPIRYEDVPLPKWTLDTSLFPSPEYTYKWRVGAGFTAHSLGGVQAVGEVRPVVIPANEDEGSQLKREFEAELFQAPSGALLYATPRLMAQPQQAAFADDKQPTEISVESIIRASTSFLIEAPAEYGGSCLAKKLALEFAKVPKVQARLADAEILPNYRAKLANLFPSGVAGDDEVLILDNFQPHAHERLLKELVGLRIFSRFIIFVADGDMRDADLPSPADQKIVFKRAFLWPMGRPEIRQLATPVFDTEDGDLLSAVVDKVYTDLLALCIPLTPSNVVMYLRILRREDDFYPLNRVEIVDRYLNELLRRPSDSYAGSFNPRNKLDIAAAFIHSLFVNQRTTFRERDWMDFCSNYIEQTLSNFDPKSLLNELHSRRVVLLLGDTYFMKYSFFYSYFLGRHLTYRQAALESFIDDEKFFEIDGVVEVVTGFGVDNTKLVTAICDRLEGYLTDFRRSYVAPDFDPYKDARWLKVGEDEEAFWKPIEEKLEAGPRDVKEVDVIKSSMSSEARTADQEVKFEEFVELKNRLFHANQLLIEAVKNSDSIDGALKRRAVSLIYQTNYVVLQLGALLSSEIAQNIIVRWGGLAFINEGAGLDNVQSRTTNILTTLNGVVARRTADQVGVSKMGEVFKSIERDGATTEFLHLINFHCILASKPNGWASSLRRYIEITDKTSFYLNEMLRALFRNFRVDVNHQRDRQQLKELIALIRVKRDHGKKNAGSNAVSKMVTFLEETDQFPDAPFAGGTQ